MTDYIGAIWRCRYFWLSLVGMDLRTRYRRSVLGLGWSLVNPLLMAAILCAVFHQVFQFKITEYGPFVLCGLAFWNYLSLVVSQGCASLQQGESYIRQYPAPMAIYPLRTMLAASFHFVVTMLIVLVLTAVLRGYGALQPLATLPLTLVLLAVFGWSVAVIFGFLNVYFPDLRHLTEVCLQFGFYATPIIYPAEMMRKRDLGLVVDLNPLAAMVELLRAPILAGQVPTGHEVGVAVATVAVTTAAAVLVLVRLEQRVIYHL